MAKLLRWAVLAMGVACVAIGLLHLVTGVGSVPGGVHDATVDSRERFYGAIFLGYGVAWLRAARRSPIPSGQVRWLALVMLLGGAGRLLSIAVHGWPHWFQLVLTATELALPPVFLWLAAADERRVGSSTA